MRTVTPHEYLLQEGVSDYLLHVYFAPADKVVELLGLYHPHVTADDVVEWRESCRRWASPEQRKGMTVQIEEMIFLEEAVSADLHTAAARRQAVEAISTATMRPYRNFAQVRAALTAALDHKGKGWELDEDAALMVRGEERREHRMARYRRQYLNRTLKVEGEPVPAPDGLQAAGAAIRYAVEAVEGAAEDHRVTPTAAPATYMQMTPFEGATLTLDADREHLNFNGQRWTLQQVNEFMTALTCISGAMVPQEAHQ